METTTTQPANDQMEIALETLPVEIFLHITRFLPTTFLLKTVSRVCKKFHRILSNEQTWKIRQFKLWGHYGKYPPVENFSEDFRWSKACWKREEQLRLWGGHAELKTIELNSHIGCVDSVLLFNGGKNLVSGSRDRSIALWDVNKCIEGDLKASLQKGNAHKGWIWGFEYLKTNEHLLSCSWDCYTKLWDLNSFTEPLSVFKCPSACLCLAIHNDIFGVGTFDRTVTLFDNRSGLEINKYVAHKKCCLALGMDERIIISCGEDGKVVLYDRRSCSVMKSFKIPSAYPKCLSFGRQSPETNPLGLFYVGDIKGNIHLVDLEKFEIQKTYSQVHGRAVQGIFHTLGSVLSCSSDGFMIVHEPSLGLAEIGRYQCKGVEFPSVHCLNNRVALAGGDSSVRLWVPKEEE